jgi:2'-5' RNA ligase
VPQVESALVVLVRQAEELRRWYRDRYAPDAVFDAPAHITLIYPFKPLAELDDSVHDALRTCCAGFLPFAFTLSSLEYFPDLTVYLPPEPAEPFRELTLALCGRFPETPPYRGRYPTIVPHLTLGRAADPASAAAIAQDFAAAASDRLPINGRAAEVALMDTSAGPWQVQTMFALR